MRWGRCSDVDLRSRVRDAGGPGSPGRIGEGARIVKLRHLVVGWPTVAATFVLAFGAAGALAATGLVGAAGAGAGPVASTTVARTHAAPRPARKAARKATSPAPARITRARFAALLAAGQRAGAKGNVNFGEILGIAAPGAGETLRINSAWNNAKHIGGSAIDFSSGLLSNVEAVQSISVQTVNVGDVSYIRPAVVTAKWTQELLKPTSTSTAGLASHLLSLAKPTAVSRTSDGRAGSTYSVKLQMSELRLLTAFSSQLPAHALRSLKASSKRLLSGLTISIPKLVVKFDRRGRLTVLEAGGIVTETRADARAQHRPYPHRGVAGVVLLHLAYRYGGSLRVSAPPASQILNRLSPLR
jgi:hypothetical protein